MDQVNKIKAAAAALLGVLTGLWGWMGWLVVGWAACMALVVLVAAGTDLLLSVVLEHLPLVELPVAYSGLICPVVLVWYIVTELGSITENAVRMGAPVPSWLVKLLAAGKTAVDTAGDKLGGKEE